jgi:DNA-binding beta-propeller fold protein YncE
MPILAFLLGCATPSNGTLAGHSPGGANPTWEPDPDTGDTAPDPTGATMSALLDENGIVDVTDVAAGAALVYATAFTPTGDALVIALDPVASTLATLHAGAPLVQPTGLALSIDESTLYLADLDGEILSLPTTGGAPVPVGATSLVLPTDVALDTDGSTLVVPAFDAAGLPCIFDVTASSTNSRACGAPMREPLAVAVSPIDGSVAIVDAMAGPGESPALLVVPPGGDGATMVAPIRGVSFPAGIAALGDGRFVYSAIGDPGLIAVTTEGTAEELDTRGVLELPAGVAAAASIVVAEASRAGDADAWEYTE